MLTHENSALFVCDLQEKLVAATHEREEIVKNASRIIEGCKSLKIPCLWSEQNPSRLGPTVDELRELLSDDEPIAKMTFSAMGAPAFREKIADLGRTHILVIGIESHVCVYQSVADLRRSDYEVEVISDAVSSRTPANKAVGLQKCLSEGALLSSVETALFELLVTAEHPAFKAIQKIIK